MPKLELILLGRLIVAGYMNLNVLAFDLLHGGFLVDMVLPVLIKLRKASAYIVNEKLR